MKFYSKKRIKYIILSLFIVGSFIIPFRYKSMKANAAGSIIITVAKTRIGSKYVYGSGHSMNAVKNKEQRRFDCSSFVSWVYYQSGYNIGVRTTSTLKDVGTQVSWNNMEPGDIMLFPHHTGIYVGNGQMIHAPHTGSYVKIVNLSGYYRKRFIQARRLAY